MKARLEKCINSYLEDNKDNLKSFDNGYDKGYAEGYHDALLDVMLAMGIDTNEEWFN